MTPALATISLACCALLVRTWWLAIDRDALAKLYAAERAQAALLRGEVANLKDANRILYQQLQGWSSAQRGDRKWVS